MHCQYQYYFCYCLLPLQWPWSIINASLVLLEVYNRCPGGNGQSVFYPKGGHAPAPRAIFFKKERVSHMPLDLGGKCLAVGGRRPHENGTSISAVTNAKRSQRAICLSIGGLAGAPPISFVVIRRRQQRFCSFNSITTHNIMLTFRTQMICK